MTREEFYEFIADLDNKIPLVTAKLVFQRLAKEKADTISLTEMIKYFD